MDHTDDQASDPAERQRAEHGLIGTEALAAHYGITTSSVRRLMSDHQVREVRGYPRDQALNLPRPGRHPAPGPGRGHRRADNPEPDS